MIDLTLENYRAFGPQSPAHFTLRRGVTALIGKNNAGKSLILRFFYEMRPLFEALAERDEPPQNDDVLSIPDPLGVEDRQRLFYRNSDGPLRITIDYKHGPVTLLIDRFHFALRVLDATPENWARLLPVFRSLNQSLFFAAHRSLGRSSKAEGQDTEPTHAFCTLWHQAWKHHPKHMEAAEPEVMDAMRRLFAFKSFSAEIEESGRIILHCDKRESLIEEAGSGVSQAFLLMAQCAAQQPHYIFIDEPECHLHPACQIDFVTLLQGFARFGLIAATHNLGLARAISEQLYQVRSSTDNSHCLLEPFTEETPRLSQSLGELDYSAQARDGCQKILLVEGPTEVKAVRQLLSKLEGGQSVIILPLGGSSMINGKRGDELEEISRICPNVYALIDSERSGKNDRLSDHHREFLESCRHAGIRAHILERRAFENYLTGAAIDRVLGRKYRELKPFEDVNRSFPKWPKSENWRVIRAMDMEDLKNTDLHQFLLEVVRDPCR